MWQSIFSSELNEARIEEFYENGVRESMKTVLKVEFLVSDFL